MTEQLMMFSGQRFDLDKTEDSWTLRLKRSDIGTQDMSALLLLGLEHPLFLKQTMTTDDDSVVFRYAVDAFGQSEAELNQLSFANKLRLALNVLSLKACLELPVNTFLHPENLFITKDLTVKVAYRGLPEVMVPHVMDGKDFLRQFKAYAFSLFTEHEFTELYDGALEVVNVPEFLNQLRQSQSLEELEELLSSYYADKLAEERQTLMQVSSIKYRLYRYATIWLSTAVVLLLVPLFYLVFFHNPFKETLLEADTAFIKVDYPTVISELERVSLARLPYTQKYELAYAYIQGLDLNSDQRQVVLNNVTLKSDESYLDYWVEIGRGNSQSALDLAKRLDDSDLILYALGQAIEQVRENTQLSGTERDSQIEALKSEYDKYWDARTSVLNEDTSASDVSDTEATDASATSPTDATTSSSRKD